MGSSGDNTEDLQVKRNEIFINQNTFITENLKSLIIYLTKNFIEGIDLNSITHMVHKFGAKI